MKSASLPQLVIYDLDGTLIDSVPDITSALAQSIADITQQRVNANHVRLWVGNGSLMLISRALEHLGIARAELDIIHSRFLHHYRQQRNQGSAIYPGTSELLQFFKARGVPQAIATNKPQQFVPALLKHHGLLHFFDAIVGGNTLPERKPSPLPLLTLCSRFCCPHSHALMIGDSQADAQSAKAAHLTCWLLEQGYGQGVDLHNLGVQRVFSTTQTMLDFVQTTYL
jgi:phosphoglycolate phosphatase